MNESRYSIAKSTKKQQKSNGIQVCIRIRNIIAKEEMYDEDVTKDEDVKYLTNFREDYYFTTEELTKNTCSRTYLRRQTTNSQFMIT